MKPTRPRSLNLGIFLFATLGGGVLVGACAGDTGPEGPTGADGVGCEVVQADGDTTITCGDTSVTVPSGSSCLVTEDATGATITCDDGSTATVSDGADGASGDDGTSCTVEEVDDTTNRISCDDGTEVLVTDGETGAQGETGETGDDGLDAGETPGLFATLEVDTPDRGYYETGETITVTMAIFDGNGDEFSFDETGTPALYLTGPRDVLLNRARVELIGAETDRAVRPHHYIELADGDDDVVYDGNTVSFTTSAITEDEEPGTYTFNVRLANSQFPLDQVQPTLDFQVGTDEVQPLIVDGCANCHEGTNGKLYMHHIDPGHSPTGSPAIDSAPPTTCYACHTTDGYAAYRFDGGRVPDPIVFRAHGVHNGANLVTEDRIGIFEDYEHVIFPAGVNNCTACHTEDDDSWYTKPSALACGSCHDRVDWATGDYLVPNGDVTEHPGGAEDPDTACTTCHGADTGLSPIRPAHAEAPHNFSYTVNLSMSDPDTGDFYVDEAPVITIDIDTIGGDDVDPADITTAAFGRAYLYVSGPRAHREPVLTTAAEGTAAIRAQVNTADAPFDLSGGGLLTFTFNGTEVVSLNVATGTFEDDAAATLDEVAAWLMGDEDFADFATAFTFSGRSGAGIAIKTLARGDASVQVTAGDVATALGLDSALHVPVETAYYAENFLALHPDPEDDDPRITRTSTELHYQLDSVEGLEPGTYSIWVEIGAAPPMSWALATFQVGQAEEEPQVATECANCHGDERMHAGYFAINFEPDICGSCHDYERQLAGNAWTESNYGFGAGPLSRRIHGVHFGHYVDKPEEIHSSVDYSGVIFPQDVRNCETCHSESDAWQTDPNRIACGGCHDADEAVAHMTLMTLDRTPEDAFSGDELESCATCHGDGAEFSVWDAHNIQDPYVPPYPRSGEGGH